MFEKKRLREFFFVNRETEWLLIVIVLLYGLFLRLVRLDYLSMWIDETISASAAKAILQHGYPLLEGGYVYARAYLFHYAMSVFIWIFGGDFGARFISVVFGVLTVYLAYLYGRKFFKGNFFKFAFPLIISVSVWSIMYSQQARFYQAFQFFYYLSFFLFYKFFIVKENYFKKKWLDYASFIVCVLITMHLQFMGYIMIPLFFLIYFISNFSRNVFKKDWFYVGLALATYFAIRIFLGLKNEIAWPRVEMYALNYYYTYLGEVALVLFALGGLVFMMVRNPMLNTGFFLFTTIPLIGLFFIKYFATRYAYFAVFALFFYVVALFNEVKYKWFLLLIFLLVQSSLFTFTGIYDARYDSSMPLADYRGAYNYVKENDSLSKYPLVTTWSPANNWYDVKADYQLNYSLSGTGHSFWREYDGGERFQGAKVINKQEELPLSFLLVIDEQGKRKIPRGRFNFECNTLFSSYNIEVQKCNT